MSEHKRDDIDGGLNLEVNPEVEEDTEAHFEELYERDAEFRAVWDARAIQRELGDRVLERRLALGISQRELAGRVGTSQNRIHLVETGDANPTLRTLERLAAVLGTELHVELTAPAEGEAHSHAHV